jgi:hypothetical protein
MVRNIVVNKPYKKVLSLCWWCCIPVLANYGSMLNIAPKVLLTIPTEMTKYGKALTIFARDRACSKVVRRLCATAEVVGVKNAFSQISEKDVDVLRAFSDRIAGNLHGRDGWAEVIVLHLFQFICDLWIDGIPRFDDYQRVTQLVKRIGNRKRIIAWYYKMLKVFPDNPAIPFEAGITFIGLGMSFKRVIEFFLRGREICIRHLSEMEQFPRIYQRTITIHQEFLERYTQELKKIPINRSAEYPSRAQWAD